VDGLLFTPPSDNSEELLDALDRASIPIVRLTPCDWQSSRPYVTANDRQVAHDMVRCLIALGHQRLPALTGLFTKTGGRVQLCPLLSHWSRFYGEFL
jgi:DNA-binding LacI/PurR family transcriptional regulator